MSEPSTAPISPPKRRVWPWLLALAFLLLAVWSVALLGYWLFTRSMTPARAQVTRGTILEVDLAGPMTEGPPLVDFGPFLTTAGGSMWQLRRGLVEAAEDPDIAGILLRPQGSMLGWANAEEVLGLIDQFRATGKPVYSLMAGDMVDDLDYFLATGGDRIWVTPEAGVIVNGLIAEAQFLRGSFEKLHIEPQVIMYKEYKSAGEQFANNEMSPYMRESLGAVLDTFAERFAARVTERRSIPADRLESFLAQGMGTAADLLDLGLADVIGYEDQVEAAFEELDSVGSFRSVGLAEYAYGLGSERASGDRIAVVIGEGPIIAQDAPAGFSLFGSAMMSGPVIAGHIERAAKDSRVRAIVFRVSSPGGSPVGSDLVRRAVVRAKEAGKPVVVSMADVAGSGGYWVAMNADAIVAQPTTITGSIGVVFQKLNLDGFYDWLGAHVDRVSTAPRAGIVHLGPMPPGERAAIESWMDQVYESFTRSVAGGRSLELEHVLEIARGRIWSGSDALENGLVDRLGGFEDAVALAHELAGVDEKRELPLVLFPRPKPLLQRLMDNDWTSVNGRSGVAPFARLALGLGLNGDLGALDRWLTGLAEPKVTARTLDVRVH